MAENYKKGEIVTINENVDKLEAKYNTLKNNKIPLIVMEYEDGELILKAPKSKIKVKLPETSVKPLALYNGQPNDFIIFRETNGEDENYWTENKTLKKITKENAYAINSTKENNYTITDDKGEEIEISKLDAIVTCFSIQNTPTYKSPDDFAVEFEKEVNEKAKMFTESIKNSFEIKKPRLTKIQTEMTEIANTKAKEVANQMIDEAKTQANKKVEELQKILENKAFLEALPEKEYEELAKKGIFFGCNGMELYAAKFVEIPVTSYFTSGDEGFAHQIPKGKRYNLNGKIALKFNDGKIITAEFKNTKFPGHGGFHYTEGGGICLGDAKTLISKKFSYKNLVESFTAITDVLSSVNFRSPYGVQRDDDNPEYRLQQWYNTNRR